MLRLRTPYVVVLIAGVLAASCAGSPVAPQPEERTPAPVPNPMPVPTPTPAPIPSTTVTLKGRVTETAPTTITEVPNAVVTILDGENAGKSVVASAMGFFIIPGLKRDSFTVSVAGEGFVTSSRRVEALADVTENFFLMPVAKTVSYTLHGEIRDTDGTCSDGVASRPCRIVMVPIHNQGMVNARLEWTSDTDVDLDLTLFKSDTPAPIQQSAQRGSAPERVGAQVSGGSNYELRITYAGGKGQAKYTITFDCPN